MVPTYEVHLFISHSWTYSGHYNTLRKWIFDSLWQIPPQAKLVFRDQSVTEAEPIPAAYNSPELDFAVIDRILQSDVVVIPTGMYAHHSVWIRREIHFARALNKPILGVNPWGQKRHASVVAKAATAMAKWNRKSIVREIWALSPRRLYTTSYTAAYR